MNHRHIQTFLAVSASFLALNAPVQAQTVGRNDTPAARVARAEVVTTAAVRPAKQNG